MQPEPQPAAANNPPTPEDIEAVARQAKHAFGNTLPKDYLNAQEYAVYERLYGAPLRETHPEDVGMPVEDVPTEDLDDPSRRVLLRETEDGKIEEIPYYTEVPAPDPSSATESQEALVESGAVSDLAEPAQEDLPSDAGLTYISAVAKSEREYNALIKLQKDFERASVQPIDQEIDDEQPDEEQEDLDEDEDEWDDEGEPDATFRSQRVHGYTQLGQWRTFPSTLHLPKIDFVTPITELLTRTDVKHVQSAAEKAFGGPGLPHSVATPESKRNAPQRGVGMEAGYHRMSEIEADAYIATNLPGMYASVMSVLVEIRKRLGSEWIQGLLDRNNGEGPRVLDVGAGGAGLAAWEQVLQTEWKIAVDAGRKLGLEPPGKKTVVVGSDHLRHRVSRFLHNTTFLPRLPDYLHSGDYPDKLDGGDEALPRKQFDVIIASHLMLPVKEGWRRNAVIDNLWEMLSPEGGILIVMEKGHPRGFEAVADVRSRLLSEFIVTPTSDPQPEAVEPEGRRVREDGSIVAPCTNHKACPMYLTPGLSPGRKDFCRFSQRFIRPPFLQNVLGAKHHNHEDIDFSFVAVQRGTPTHLAATTTTTETETDTETETSRKNAHVTAAARAFAGYEASAAPPDPRSLPRNILPPLKRRGHVTMDLCTPEGTIERWTVPRSFSQQAYHDARKTRWGDLWALGAKTRVVRPVRLGKGGLGAGAKKPTVVNLTADSGGIYSAQEQRGGRGGGKANKKPERRTKGGKKARPRDLMAEMRRGEA